MNEGTLELETEVQERIGKKKTNKVFVVNIILCCVVNNMKTLSLQLIRNIVPHKHAIHFENLDKTFLALMQVLYIINQQYSMLSKTVLAFVVL